MLNLPNYQIGSQIYESANSIVYRGGRKKDNQPVILKMLKQDYPTPAELTRYRQEYEITHDLDLAGVIKTYGLEKYQNTLVIILEEFGGESLKHKMAERPFVLKEFLPLAIQISDSLGNIHAANIIHKDINPSNIVVNQKTKALKIIDFGIASRLPRENPALKNPEQLEGTLAYLSPEQTGRINRSLDYRTDLYSLGVTFYEMLTGFVPFDATDAMELVHCHIAKTPSPLCEINSDIPPMVSNIVMMLLAKNAEDRYQSAFGLKADLEKCLEKCLALTKKVFGKRLFSTRFELAQHDFSGKFEIPQKLYGRNSEVNTLLQAFERVSFGATEMMLVAGYSGVGKTALVHEVHKPMTEKRGYFTAGKFDQFQKNIPYSALAQAFNEFCRYLLMENAENLAHLQTKILEAVGNNGQIIIDVIPDLELVIGKQPVVAEVGATEAQNRFQMFFLNFIKVLCDKRHPFILFIDDLQWVDSASLGLLKSIMLDDEIRHLLIIGAYRDNEVDGSHPFIMAVDELQKANAIINTIELGNFQLSDINHLLQDTLRCEASQTLADLVYQKTQGNAFFTHQFLQTLYSEALLRFEQQQWCWDVSRIAAQNITANVVELMANKIEKLPSSTSTILQLAACIGNQFDLSTLTIISEQNETLSVLGPAVTEGLILPLDEKSQFKFLHDRVQQAAYALIDSEKKQAVHLQIGRLLLANVSSEKLAEKHFEIVDHLNMGRELMTEVQEQIELAQLNLEAGQKAKHATAYAAALQYLAIGVQCLNDNHWVTDYHLIFTLYKETAEVEFLNGHFEQSEALIYATLDKTESVIEKSSLYSMLIVQYTTLAKYEEATQAGRTALSLMGINLPATDFATALQTEMAAVHENLGERAIASVVEAAEMTELLIRASTQVLVKLITTTYQSNQELFAVVVVKIVNASLKHGNISESPFGYSAYGLLLGSVFGDYKTGAEFGAMAYSLSEKFHNMSQKCAVCDVLSGHAYYWTHPLKNALVYSDEGYQAGLESGELQVTGYIMMFKLYNLFSQGLNLNQLREEISRLLAVSKKHQNQLAIDTIRGCQIGVLNLSGLTADQLAFENDEMDDELFTKECCEHQTTLSLCMYQILKLQILYLYDKPAEALEYAQNAEQQIAYVLGVFCVAEHNFYTSLTLVALYPSASPKLQQQYLEKLETNQQQMKIWADNCPENFLPKYLLVQAEIARVNGNELEAMDLYDQAIASAKEADFIQNEALANELVAKFWLSKNKEEIAQIYLKKAHYTYQQWGAMAKVADLDTKYPQLLTTPKTLSQNVTMTGTVMPSSTTRWQTGAVLDLGSVTKAAQTLAGEIVLSRLLEKMMHLVIENAGAERGFLLLPQGEQWVIEAEGAIDKKEVTTLHSLPAENHLPKAILNYVVRTHDNVVLANAKHEGIYIQDTYIKAHQTQSVLCFPIVYQLKLRAILYLENNLIEAAFTEERLKVLKMLSSQIAISLENAQVMAHLDRKVADRTAQLNAKVEELTQTRFELVQSEKMASLGRLVAGFAHELNTPLGVAIGSASTLRRKAKEINQLIEKEEVDVDELLAALQNIDKSSKLTLSNLERAANLVTSFKRTAVDQTSNEVRSFQVQEVINDTINTLQNRFKNTEIDISVDCPKELKVKSLPGALEQILTNLLMNSLIHGFNEGQNAGSININAQLDGNNLHLEYSDNGKGIAQENLEKIFEPFFTTYRAHGGSGLGMYICYNFVTTQLQGTISCESTLGKGVLFKIDYPIE